MRACLTANIVIACYFNQLSETRVVAYTGFMQIVRQPTHGTNVLDQIFVTDPYLYDTVRVITSFVMSDHKAIVAYSESHKVTPANKSTRVPYRKVSPGQHAAFLQHVSENEFINSTPSDNVQAAFDSFYSIALGLLNKFYPVRTITRCSRDPEYITPYIKSLLRKKNRLM